MNFRDFYNVKNGSSNITSKSSSKNLSNGEMFTQKIELMYFIEVVGVDRNGPKSFFIYELSFILFYVS